MFADDAACATDLRRPIARACVHVPAVAASGRPGCPTGTARPCTRRSPRRHQSHRCASGTGRLAGIPGALLRRHPPGEVEGLDRCAPIDEVALDASAGRQLLLGPHAHGRDLTRDDQRQSAATERDGGSIADPAAAGHIPLPNERMRNSLTDKSRDAAMFEELGEAGTRTNRGTGYQGARFRTRAFAAHRVRRGAQPRSMPRTILLTCAGSPRQHRLHGGTDAEPRRVLPRRTPRPGQRGLAPPAGSSHVPSCRAAEGGGQGGAQRGERR